MHEIYCEVMGTSSLLGVTSEYINRIKDDGQDDTITEITIKVKKILSDINVVYEIASLSRVFPDIEFSIFFE